MIKKIIITATILFFSLNCHAYFYVKMTPNEAKSNISRGMIELFGGLPKTFGIDTYTEPLIDPENGDVYWMVIDLKIGKHYKIEEWFINTFPNIRRYSKDEIASVLARIREKHENAL